MEQFEKGRNYAGFTVYLTVRNTVGPVFLTVEGLFFTVKIMSGKLYIWVRRVGSV